MFVELIQLLETKFRRNGINHTFDINAVPTELKRL